MSARDSELFDAISHRNELILSLVIHLLSLLDDFSGSPEPPSRTRVGSYVSLTRRGGGAGRAAGLLRDIESISAAVFLRLGMSWDVLATAADLVADGMSDTTRQALHRRLAHSADREMEDAISTRRLHGAADIERALAATYDDIEADDGGYSGYPILAHYAALNRGGKTGEAVWNAIAIESRSAKEMLLAAPSVWDRYTKLRAQPGWWREDSPSQ